MTKDETFDLPDNPLVQMLDGSIGMFLIWPIGTGEQEGLCGIQVPGESEHRWVHHDNLLLDRGLVFETHKPVEITKYDGTPEYRITVEKLGV